MRIESRYSRLHDHEDDFKIRMRRIPTIKHEEDDLIIASRLHMLADHFNNIFFDVERENDKDLIFLT